jgi:hypothetical protein
MKHKPHECLWHWDQPHLQHPYHFLLSMHQCSAVKLQMKDNSVRCITNETT